MNKNREKLLNTIVGSVSSVAALASLYISYCIYYKGFVSLAMYPSFKLFCTVLIGEILFINIFTGINRSFIHRGIYREFIYGCRNLLIVLSGLILVLFWFHMIDETKRLIFGYFSVLFVILDYAARLAIKRYILSIFNRSKFSNRVLVVTQYDSARSVIIKLDKSFDWTKQFIGICLDTNSDKAKKSTSIRKKHVVCSYDKLLNYVTRNNIDELFVFVSETKLNELKDALSQIEEIGVKINISINFEFFDYLPNSFIRYDKVGPFQCISVSRNYLSYRDRFAKKSLDYLGGFVGVLIFAFAYLFIAPLIKLDSKGPVLFKQPRVGRNGRIFNCYKFRSMVVDAEELKKKLLAKNEMDGLMFKMENDPRITKLGKFIRKTSIDELPQFINVLRGDMSLVGTRPPTVDEYNNYEPKHKARVSMAPGLTGLWQVSGRSNIKNFEDVVALDMQYIDNWSILLDIKIILKTIKMVFVGVGAK